MARKKSRPIIITIEATSDAALKDIRPSIKNAIKNAINRHNLGSVPFGSITIRRVKVQVEPVKKSEGPRSEGGYSDDE